MKVVYQALGFLFLLLGIVGIFLPGMPTTVFILLTAWCWARGSERFYHWLIHHRRFGPIVHHWQMHRAIPRRAKLLAISMMTISTTILFFTMPSQYIWAAYATAAICLPTAIWMIRLPNIPSSRPTHLHTDTPTDTSAAISAHNATEAYPPPPDTHSGTGAGAG